MDSVFITMEEFQHQIDCFCASQKHVNTIYFQVGDEIVVTEEFKYVDQLGWYVKVKVSNTYQFFIATEDLEMYYEAGKIASETDRQLSINYFQFKVDQALEEKNEEAFLFYVKQLEKYQQVSESLNT
ncbi:hypothetical protein [Thalassobacillus hwangdonensis]|uniref:IDEAL domain-containing protein n=1 Tax=Thalassobacillus hwangdonensis TaxID=546108 RepID=A0ABW3L4A3_9BACI